MPVDETIDAAARRHAQKVFDSGRLKQASYTGLPGDVGMYFAAFVGELAFAQLLQARQRKFLYFLNSTGRSGPEEFKLFLRDATFFADVKTSRRSADDLLIPQVQAERRDGASIYVAARLAMPHVEFHGYVKRADVLGLHASPMKHGVQTFVVPFDWLKPIEALLEKLDAGEGELVVWSKEKNGGPS